MKKIEAIVRQSRLSEVEHALHSHGFNGMTLTEVHGLGREQGTGVNYRGAELECNLALRHKLELIVADEVADEAVDAIFRAAHTGDVGDGRILVTSIDGAIHIRTGEIEGALHPAST